MKFVFCAHCDLVQFSSKWYRLRSGRPFFHFFHLLSVHNYALHHVSQEFPQYCP